MKSVKNLFIFRFETSNEEERGIPKHKEFLGAFYGSTISAVAIMVIAKYLSMKLFSSIAFYVSGNIFDKSFPCRSKYLFNLQYQA